MKASWKIGAILCVWSLSFSLPVEGTIPQFWNLFSRGSALPLVHSTTDQSRPPVVFKGSKIHPTENYPYPTPPPEDSEFTKWEQEQEKKYAEEILAKLASPNDTQLQFKAKTLIANFLVNVVKDNATNSDKSSIEKEVRFTVPNNPSLLAKEDLFQSNQFANQINPYLQTSQFINQENPPLQSYEGVNQENSYQQSNQPNQENYNPESNPDVDEYYKFINPEGLPPGALKAPPSTAGPLGLPFNPINSILNVISPNRNNYTEPEGNSSSSSLGSIFDNYFRTKPPGVSTTRGPDVRTEFFVVPVHPTTEPNTISNHQKDILNQVGRLRDNVSRRNISGVVDESLKLASIQTIGVLLNGFLDIILCNPVDRWNGKCNEHHR